MNKNGASLHDQNLKARLSRLISGDLNVDDIAKIYAGMRSSSCGRTSFRELADFAAHPDKRNRGPVVDRIRDMRTTFKPLFDKALGDRPLNLDDIYSRAEANLRMASDEQIVRISGGRSRKQVKKTLSAAIDKMRKSNFGDLTAEEQQLAINFGDRVIWNPAIRAQEIFDDFKFVVLKNRLLKTEDSEKLDSLRSLVVLHAISVIHGTAFDLGEGMTGELKAGFNNEQGFLEITAVLKLVGYKKAVSQKVGLFWTDLLGREYVEPILIKQSGPWDFAIEIKNSRISPIGKIPPKKEVPHGAAVVSIP